MSPSGRQAFRGRSRGYFMTLGTFALVLAVGLAIPFGWGHPVGGERSGASLLPDAAAGQSGAIVPGSSPGSGKGTSGGSQPGSSVAPSSAGTSSSRGTGAGGSPSPASTGGSSTTGVGLGVPRTAVQTLKIGIPIFDLGFSVPGADPKEQIAQWNAYVNDVNVNGGLNDTKLSVVFASYNPLTADSAQAACVSLTEDSKVSAVLAYGLFDTQALCYTEQHHTPLFNGIGFSDEVYRRSAGRAFTSIINKTRAGRVQVDALDRMGVLKGKKIGILTSADRNDDQAAQGGIVKSLSARGYKVAQYSNLSSDLATGNSQIPVETQQMISHGVDLVFLAANLQYSGGFVAQGYSQNWKPQYVTSDLDQLAEDANTQRFGAGFDGAIGITVLREGEFRGNSPEPAIDKRCREVYERAAGVTYSRGQLVYNTTMAQCSVVDMIARGLRSLKGKFSADGLVQAMQRIGSFPVAYEANGSIQDGKNDLPSAARAVRWSNSCTCFSSLAPYRPIPI